ncbi:polysaccharide biosynthesis protein [Candidatus Kirkpatrickella diaphorinae]|uniref:Polysaccharide biosynthesis protein n=1 Tax=Candidatus Kirkpatrickella diaphorinae TaxID=2984322 RepID=A0ABY6GLB1_9PROT|nr:nucleoside-diphosphate sugar epimerase/dehydratase [Candidatus Kirkpatrickella diaphorinae]UYH52107.1 polysaccharide biosynthesis protein [Candidatus Kirkpatrickella diaphorinae]
MEDAQQNHQAKRSVSEGNARRFRAQRIAVNVLLDALISGLAAPIAVYLAAPRTGILHPLWAVAGGAVALLLSGLPLRVPQQYWRFSGITDLRNIAIASLGGAALFSIAVIMLGYRLPSVTFPIIYALVLLVGLGGGRLMARAVHGFRQRGRGASSRALLIGTDTSCDLFIRAVSRHPAARYDIIGIVTRAADQIGRRLHDTPILGVVDDVPALLDRLAAQDRLPEHIIIADPDWRGALVSDLLDAAQAHGVPVQRAPSLMRLTPADTIELRPIALEDLLNRAPVSLDVEGMERLMRGRVVMVTGAGGSIGGELVRQVAGFAPSCLLLVDNNEFALWRINLELSDHFADVPCRVLVGDIRDRYRMTAIFQQYQPDVVFHAAALKHVPIVEDNPCEGILTNVIGTRIVVDAAQAHGTQALVLISSDKAVNPTGVMGATKRCAEIYCQAIDLARRAAPESSTFRCVTVRFGNVLGSTGSVVPLFTRQLRQGGPLTVTHPDVTRFFMTISEAVSLVLQASVRGTTARKRRDETDRRLDKGGIFVLDMGEPVKIQELARQMIKLAGLKPDRDIAIKYTGLRPGEKLYEELFHIGETSHITDMPGLLIATPRVADLADVCAVLDRLEQLCHDNAHKEALTFLQKLVPEFVHNPSGDAWVAR